MKGRLNRRRREGCVRSTRLFKHVVNAGGNRCLYGHKPFVEPDSLNRQKEET